MLIRLSRRCRGRDGVVTVVGIPRVEYTWRCFWVAQQVSCVTVLYGRVLYIHRGTEDEFWRGIDQNRPAKFPTTAFSDKSRSNSKKVKTKTKRMMGLD